jgi:hypothetical protein
MQIAAVHSGSNRMELILKQKSAFPGKSSIRNKQNPRIFHASRPKIRPDPPQALLFPQFIF